MAHFFGSVEGSRGDATRLGTRNSGMQTVAASWQGCVRVNLSERDGVDWAHVTLAPWQGKGSYVELYSGPVAGMPKQAAA